MRADSPGGAPNASTTVRPAEKGASTTGVDPALMRRTVTAMQTIAGCRRSEARERVHAWLAGGATTDDLEAWLRQGFRTDPTGTTAVRNVMRGGDLRAAG